MMRYDAGKFTEHLLMPGNYRLTVSEESPYADFILCNGNRI